MQNVVIIGGGIVGLTAAYRLQTEAAGQLSYQLVEASSRLGGKIVTDQASGFVVEGGPDSVIAHKPWALELMRELGLENQLLPSNDDRGGVRILHHGELEPVPAGLQLLSPERWGELLRSPLLSWPAKLRFAAERWRQSRPDSETEDESVASFVRRRLGEEALWNLAEPMLAHLHAADVERMSLQATYPRLAELETRFGSLHRGVATMRARQASAPKKPIFWTLKGGLAQLVATLAEQLEPSALHLGRRATSLRRSGDGWIVSLDDDREIETDAVLLTTPADDAARLTDEIDPELAKRLRAIRYTSMATLSLGYRIADLPRIPSGFGFFVPRHERRAILAGSWTSTKFDHRAPEGHALLRIFLGGDGGGGAQQKWLELDDEALIDAVRKDLSQVLGWTAEPTLRWLTRWPHAYPQYDVGHPARVREIEAALPPDVVVAGSSYHGVGLPDCIRSGTEAARQILESLTAG